MSTVRELQARAHELKVQERQLRAAARELKRKACSDSSAKAVTPWMRAVALRVFALAGLNEAASVSYLQSKGRSVGDGEVRTWHAALPEEAQRALLTCPEEAAKTARQHAEAVKFVQEMKLLRWIREQNKKSIAPTPGAILSHGADVFGSGRESSRYRRLRRLMARSGGRKGVFADGDRLSPEVFGHKVRKSLLLHGCLLLGQNVRFGGPRLGTGKRSRFGQLLLISIGAVPRGPKYGPTFGTIFVASLGSCRPCGQRRRRLPGTSVLAME